MHSVEYMALVAYTYLSFCLFFGRCVRLFWYKFLIGMDLDLDLDLGLEGVGIAI